MGDPNVTIQLENGEPSKRVDDGRLPNKGLNRHRAVTFRFDYFQFILQIAGPGRQPHFKK